MHSRRSGGFTQERLSAKGAGSIKGKRKENQEQLQDGSKGKRPSCAKGAATSPYAKTVHTLIARGDPSGAPHPKKATMGELCGDALARLEHYASQSTRRFTAGQRQWDENPFSGFEIRHPCD
jgi:hypothetical protein